MPFIIGNFVVKRRESSRSSFTSKKMKLSASQFRSYRTYPAKWIIKHQFAHFFFFWKGKIKVIDRSLDGMNDWVDKWACNQKHRWHWGKREFLTGNSHDLLSSDWVRKVKGKQQVHFQVSQKPSLKYFLIEIQLLFYCFSLVPVNFSLFNLDFSFISNWINIFNACINLNEFKNQWEAEFQDSVRKRFS